MRFTIRAISFFLALSCFAVLASCGNNGANESETASPFAVESAEPSTESVDHTEEGVRLLYKVSNPAFGSWTVSPKRITQSLRSTATITARRKKGT